MQHHILIIDDNESGRVAVKRMIERTRLEIEVFTLATRRMELELARLSDMVWRRLCGAHRAEESTRRAARSIAADHMSERRLVEGRPSAPRRCLAIENAHHRS